MDDDKNNLTEAELQIERLKRLKDQKDTKEKKLKEEVFKYAELPHAVTTAQPEQSPAHEESRPDEPAAAAAGPRHSAPKPKKQQRASRIERKNFDRIKSIVRDIKASNRSIRLSEDMLVNMILSRVLELDPGFSGAADMESLKALLKKIKAE